MKSGVLSLSSRNVTCKTVPINTRTLLHHMSSLHVIDPTAHCCSVASVCDYAKLLVLRFGKNLQSVETEEGDHKNRISLFLIQQVPVNSELLQTQTQLVKMENFSNDNRLFKGGESGTEQDKSTKQNRLE